MPTTNTHTDNGSRLIPDRPLDSLAFADVDRNSYGRASVNSAWTYRRTTGQFDLGLRLLQELCSDLKDRTPTEAIDIDPLNCHRMEPLIQQRLQAVPELVEHVTNDLDHAQQILRDLIARKPAK